MRLPHDNARQKRIEELIRGQYDRLAALRVDREGGWGYLRLWRRHPATQQRLMQFRQCHVLVAFYEAKQIGVHRRRNWSSEASRESSRSATPTSAIFMALSAHRPRMEINRPGGSLGRSQACNLALRLWGDRKVTDAILAEWLDRLIVRNGWLDMGRKRPIPHESHFMVAGYFYYYGHYYATLCVDQLPVATSVLPGPSGPHLVRTSGRDGSWWDYPLYNYHQQYGTAFALFRSALPQPVASPVSLWSASVIQIATVGWRRYRISRFPRPVERGRQDLMDRLDDQVFGRGGEARGMTVVDHRAVGLVAPLAQDAARRDVTGYVVAVGGDPEAVGVDLPLEPQGVVDDHLAREEDHRHVVAEAPGLDDVWHSRGQRFPPVERSIKVPRRNPAAPATLV